MNPTVSVLMPVYNSEQFLAQAIDSVLAQTWTDFEFIIVDDGSTDQTGAILQAYAARDRRIVLQRHGRNLGLTRALNAGLAVARGRFVARHDADDLSLPQRLERQVRCLDDRPEVGLLATAITLIDDRGQVLRDRYFDTHLTNEALQRQLLNNICIGHGSVVMRRECLDRVGGYDPALEPSEDHDLWLRLAEITQLASLPEPLYAYRQHPASVSHRRHSEQVLRLAQGIENALRRRNGPASAGAALAPAARAHLRAAIAAAGADDLAEARRRLKNATGMFAALLDDPEPLASLLQDQTARGTATEGARLYQRFFDECLPHTAMFGQLRSQVMGLLYMREVFAGARLGDRARIRAHLWAGLRADPAWLLNRGVLAITVRHLLGA
jgi:glycosyltransferase involved in cell wall biosynthesis